MSAALANHVPELVGHRVILVRLEKKPNLNGLTGVATGYDPPRGR